MTPETTRKIAGPPGTGKTTYLLNQIETLLKEGVQPEEIIFTTFTKAGVNEAVSRASTRFNISPNRFHGFRTLHALCYQNAPNKGPVMMPSDWMGLARQLGLSFSIKFSSEEYLPQGQTRGDYLLNLWSLGRVRRLPTLEAMFNERHKMMAGHSDVSFAEFEHFVKTVHSHKQDHGKIDFTDMLEDYLLHGPDMHVPYVIVDEAQDLSRLQWDVVHKISRQAKLVLVAGDDDQCIHEWNGADPKPFINLPARQYEVLPQSYRIPCSVHSLAERIIFRVKSRLPKEYKARTDAGAITRMADPFLIDMSKGSWLLLARNNAMLQRYIELCLNKGLLFTSTIGAGVKAPVLHAIANWKTLQKDGGTINHSDLPGLYDLMATRDRVDWGMKTKLTSAPPGNYTYEMLTQNLGMKAPKNMHWSQALNRIPHEMTNYLKQVEKNEGLTATPRIHISTIHGAKGGEADNVVLMPDMSHKTFESYRHSPDSEHRVFYVAVTRARNHLYILHPQDIKSYPV